MYLRILVILDLGDLLSSGFIRFFRLDFSVSLGMLAVHMRGTFNRKQKSIYFTLKSTIFLRRCNFLILGISNPVKVLTLFSARYNSASYSKLPNP